MSPSQLDFLRHILNECDYLLRLKQGKDREQLLDDETNSRAIVRSLEVIGEATKKVPDEIRSENPKVSWNEMAGMRDVLIHNYFGIDYDIVWNVMLNNIPELHGELIAIIEREEARSEQ